MRSDQYGKDEMKNRKKMGAVNVLTESEALRLWNTTWIKLSRGSAFLVDGIAC